MAYQEREPTLEGKVQDKMVCSKCGAVNEGSNFCYKCGEPLTDPWQIPTIQEVRGIIDDVPPKTESPLETHANMIGRTIEDRYHLDALIGTGGMGAVYRATRLLIGDTVAIKILRQEQVADPQLGERFRREAQAAARLKHPNAVSIYDFGVSKDGLFYLVMELIEGRSLRQMIVERGALPVPAAVEIMRHVCSALDEAHRYGVIHRDVKPDNILVTQTPNGFRVKVLDFGIAKLRDQTASNLTQTGSVVGTPRYMSPEQCIGEELDHRSDIYSLGIVLYEMLAGVVPFNAPISTAVVIQHVNNRPPSLREANPNIPAAVEAVVMRALEKRRESRPQTAGMMAQELAAAAAMLSEPTRPATVKPPSVVAYNAPPVAPLVSSPSSSMPTLVMSAPQANQHVMPGSVAAYAPSPRPDDRVSIPLLVAVVVLAILVGSALTYLLIQSKEKSVAATPTPTPEASRNRKTENASGTPTPAPTAPVMLSNSAPSATPASARPASASSYAVCMYIGVNVRMSPDKNSPIVKTINKGQGMWVLRESSNYEEVYIRSENRSVTGNWSEVQLDDSSSTRGWVFSGFLSKS